MNMKKTGKVLVLLGASAALIASLVNDKKGYIISSNITGSKKIVKFKCNILTKIEKMHIIILR